MPPKKQVRKPTPVNPVTAGTLLSAFAKHGVALIALGQAMQREDATLRELVSLALDAGLVIRFGSVNIGDSKGN